MNQINQNTLKCLLAYDILCYNIIDLQVEEKHMMVWMIKSDPARSSVDITLRSGMAVSLLSTSRHQTVCIFQCPQGHVDQYSCEPQLSQQACGIMYLWERG